MSKLTSQQIIDSLKEMSLIEINDLIKEIEIAFGVSAAAPVAVAVESQKEEAPSTVTVTIKEAGAQKIAVIKIFRELTGLGLMEAKTAVDKCPAVVKENIKPEEATEIKKKLEEVGAKVEVK